MSETFEASLTGSWYIRLRHIIGEYFSEDDLRTICFDLRVDFDDLAGDTKSQQAASLMTLMANSRCPAGRTGLVLFSSDGAYVDNVAVTDLSANP